MDAVIIIQSGRYTDPGQAGAFIPVLNEYGFCMDEWESNKWPNILDTSNMKEPRRFFSRTADLNVVDKVMKAARAQHLFAAVHIDASTSDDCYEWDHLSYLTWWDPILDTSFELSAGSITLEPDLSMQTVVDWLEGNNIVPAFWHMVRALRILGLLKYSKQ